MKLTHLSIIFTFLIASFVTLATTQVISPGDKPCPAHEVWWDCGANCQRECASLDKPCMINYIRCPEGCYCDDGYARNAKGKCIPIDLCSN